MKRKAPKNLKEFKNIKEIIYNSTEIYKNNIAFTLKEKDGEKTTYVNITYEQFLQNINNLGTGLFKKQIKNKKIAIIGKNSYNWSLVHLSVLLGGNILVPIDKDLQYEELERTIIRSEAYAIIFDSKFSEYMERIKNNKNVKIKEYISMQKSEKYISLKEIEETGKKLIQSGEREYIDAKIDENKIAELIFTSGTTSESKAVMLSHKNIAANIYSMQISQCIMPTDVNIALLPFHHVYGSTGLLMMLASGAKTVYTDGLKYISQNLKEYGVTVFVGVPLIIEAIYRRVSKEIEKKGKTKKVENARKISNILRKFHIDLRRILFKEIINGLGGKLEYVVLGGAPANVEIINTLNDFGIVTTQGYGLTETSPVVSSENYNCLKPGSVGKPLKNIELKIEAPDENGIGEIAVRGKNVMLGYYKNEEATKEVIRDGWFYTGDLGRFDEKGFLYISGRHKNMIVLKNGKKVFPEELEELVNKIELVKESMVFGLPDPKDNTDIKLSVKVVYDKELVDEKYENLSLDEIKEIIWKQIKEINKTFPKYKYIKNIILTDQELIKTTTKKIKRNKELERILNKN